MFEPFDLCMLNHAFSRYSFSKFPIYFHFSRSRGEFSYYVLLETTFHVECFTGNQIWNSLLECVNPRKYFAFSSKMQTASSTQCFAHTHLKNIMIMEINQYRCVKIFDKRRHSLMARELGPVWARALDEVVVLCSLTRFFALTVPPSTQVYGWILVTLMLGGCNPLMD